MKSISAFFGVLSILIIIAGFIPMFINVCLYLFPPLTIIIFIYLSYLIYRKYNSKALTFTIIAEICSFLSYKFFMSSPGTTDNLEGLPEIFNHIFLSCLFVIIEVIAIFFILSEISKENIKRRLLKKQAETINEESNTLENQNNVINTEDNTQDINNNIPKNY